MSAASPDGRRRVLVKEKIGEPGVALLREHFDVDLGVDWPEGELAGLEMTLAGLGHQLELGAGPGAAQQVFLEAGVAPTPA